MSNSMDDFDYTDMLSSAEDLDSEESLPDHETTYHDDGFAPNEMAGSAGNEGSLSYQTQGNQNDVVIAVMGTTGSGKSSFVRLPTGDTSVPLGHSLESETSDIQVVRYIDPNSGRDVAIVDTPGFDDSRESINDTEVLKRTAKFLLDIYDKDRKLNGLIYVQRISDPRFGGQSARNLRMFRNLCGESGFKNVVVLTTFWDKLTKKSEGVKRETELKSKFFKELVKGGARFMQHDRSFRSAQEVLNHVFTLVPTNVRIQEEIRVEGKSLEDTAAGSVHWKEVEQLIAKHGKDIAELRAEMDDARRTNVALAQELKGERDKLQRKLKDWESERDELKKGLDEEKKAVEQLKEDAEGEKKNHERWCKDKEIEWTGRLDSQEKTHMEALEKVQGQLNQEKEVLRQSAARAEEMIRNLEERGEKDRRALEEQRQEEEHQWSTRMKAQADAHKQAVQKMQERVEQAQEVSEGVKLAERMRRIEETAEKDRKALEEQRREDERQWSQRMKSQEEAHDKTLQKMQAQAEEQKKALENMRMQEADRRANAAERDKLAAERRYEAEKNKSYAKAGKLVTKSRVAWHAT